VPDTVGQGGELRSPETSPVVVRPPEELAMEASFVSGLSAVFGSLVGAGASIATAWFTQRAQGRRETLNAEIRRRELVYTEFISECSRLSIDALDHTLDSPGGLVQVYGLLNRIRLTSSDAVVAAADASLKSIVDRYFQPHLSLDELRALVMASHRIDPLQGFSEACRHELRTLLRGV
jgi:hypothetical protein